MHEAGLLAAAVAEAMEAGAPAGATGSGTPGARPVAIEIRIHDPIHIAVESARLHAELALRARGLSDVAITVIADPVACVLCGVENEVYADHPFCDACGWPLPDRGGHQVEAVLTWGRS
jgi:hypothetical protein